VDFIERYADSDRRWHLRGGAVLTKPPSDHPDLEVSGAVAATRSAVGHADGDGDRPGVWPVQTLHERLRGPTASTALELVDIHSRMCGVGNGDLADVGEGRWVLAVVADVGEQEGAEVDLSASGQDKQGGALDAASVRHDSHRRTAGLAGRDLGNGVGVIGVLVSSALLRDRRTRVNMDRIQRDQVFLSLALERSA
jgi:hypothetical protein